MIQPPSSPSLHARRLLRALTLRCPLCGHGAGRRGLTLPGACPHCGFRYDRGESDYFLGSYTLNLFVALLGAATVAAAGIVLPERVGRWMVPAAMLLVVGLAVVLHPVARLGWLAIDLVFRPPHEGDFRPPADPAA